MTTYTNISEIPNVKAQQNSVDLKEVRSILASYKVSSCAIADVAVSISKEKRALEVLLSEKRKAYSAIVTGDLTVIGSKVDELEGLKKSITEYSAQLSVLTKKVTAAEEAQEAELSKGVNWLKTGKVYEAYCASDDEYAVALCNIIPGFGMKDFNKVSLRRTSASNKNIVKNNGRLTAPEGRNVFYKKQLRILADYFEAVLPTAKFSKAALDALKKK